MPTMSLCAGECRAVLLAELTACFDGRLAHLERRVTLGLGAITVAGIGVVSVLAELL
jgi:hypothetical protein